MRLESTVVVTAIVASTMFSQAFCEATLGGNELVSPSPQTAWLARSTPEWRIWVRHTVDPERRGVSDGGWCSSYYRQSSAEEKAVCVHVSGSSRPRVLALLGDGTVVLDGNIEGHLRWISPGDPQGGKLIRYDGLDKEWRVVAGYADGLLTAPYDGGSPPGAFMPIRNGQLIQAEKVDLPIHTRLNVGHGWQNPIVRHKNTLVWIERPHHEGTPEARKFSRLIAFQSGCCAAARWVGVDVRERIYGRTG